MITKLFSNLARNSKFLFNNKYISKNYNNKIPIITNYTFSAFSKKHFCEKKTEEPKSEKNDKPQKKEKENKKPEEKKVEEKKAETKKPEEKKSVDEKKADSKEEKKAEAEKKPDSKEEKKAEADKKPKEDKKPPVKENTNAHSANSNQVNSGLFDNKKYISLVETLMKEPTKLMEDKDRTYQQNIEKQLLPNQKKFVDKVARYFSTMNLAQINHSLNKLEIDINKIKLDAPIHLNKDLPSKSTLGDPTNPNIKDFTAQKDLMISLSKWFIEQNPGFGLGSGPAGGAAKAEEKVEKVEKKEQKAEKEIYDIELTAFDAAKKIGLIKEVRTLTNLGLKEAKELVEKAPTILLKGIKKAEAEELVKKMKDAGATITLK